MQNPERKLTVSFRAKFSSPGRWPKFPSYPLPTSTTTSGAPARNLAEALLRHLGEARGAGALCLRGPLAPPGPFPTFARLCPPTPLFQGRDVGRGASSPWVFGASALKNRTNDEGQKIGLSALTLSPSAFSLTPSVGPSDPSPSRQDADC